MEEFESTVKDSAKQIAKQVLEMPMDQQIAFVKELKSTMCSYYMRLSEEHVVKAERYKAHYENLKAHL